jgi:hypothetical protein
MPATMGYTIMRIAHSFAESSVTLVDMHLLPPACLGMPGATPEEVRAAVVEQMVKDRCALERGDVVHPFTDDMRYGSETKIRTALRRCVRFQTFEEYAREHPEEAALTGGKNGPFGVDA